MFVALAPLPKDSLVRKLLPGLVMAQGHLACSGERDLAWGGLAWGLEDLVNVSQSHCFKACFKLEGHGQGNVFFKNQKIMTNTNKCGNT